MDMREQLRTLQKEQVSISDGHRLYHDGSIKIQSLTAKAEIGWCVIAKPVPAASPSIRKYFPQHPDGMYLKVEGIREAIALRDIIFEKMVEARVMRQNEMSLGNI